MSDKPDPLEIPEFLKIPQSERSAAWDKHRTVAKPIPASMAANESWRADRNRLYNEAARKEAASGQSQS